MNSILHTCTHTNDSSLLRMTDDQMFGAIFAYIDHLFNIIKPQKVFYMAIDGVAPRAKMNQQRARRFRSAIEAEQNLEKAIKEGKEIPKEPPFDSNAITPGTEFMAKLTENLKFYINQKASSDSRWQNMRIILSGHEVPGEGEHKIMDFIRTQKAQPDYDPNTRHCVYGLDADLIMLGLVAHEPHFALLREEVTFGPKANSHSDDDLTQQTFFLLHISLVREYMELEFQDLQDQLSFEYDFERIIDDFILIMYVIGNDFLPNLPDLHLNKGAFPLLIETFKEAIRDMDGYINEFGTINLQRFGKWLEYLSVFELENFEKGEVDVEWFNKQLDNISKQGMKKRLRQGKELLLKQQKKFVGLVREWIYRVYSEKFDVKAMLEDESKVPELPLPRDVFESEINRDVIAKFLFELGVVVVHSKSQDTYTARLDVDGINPDETDEEFNERVEGIRRVIKKYQSSIVVEDEETLESQKDLYDARFVKWKNEYYKNKVGFSLNDEDKIRDMAENYIEGLQWVLNYYYKGISSWPWYYRYHYAPRISDVSKGLNVKISFEKGHPFKPFQQLMAVLPARSKQLIPSVYRPLMTDSNSPIIDFYPDDCEVDMNGKKAPWEAVVLLSFVDEKRLIEAMTPFDSKLSPEEKRRNSFGTDLQFHFNPQIKHLIKSPLPASFSDFESHCTETEFHLPSLEGLKLNFGLCKGAKFGREALAGFPSLKTIPCQYNLEYANVVVFQQPSKAMTLMLTLENLHSSLTVEQFAKEYVGQIVYTKWPFLREAKVVYVTDNLMKYEKVKMGSVPKVVSSPLEPFERDDFEKTRAVLYHKLQTNKGVRFQAAGAGEESEESEESSKSSSTKNPIEGLVYVRAVNGLIRNEQGAFVKTYAKEIECYPIQLIVDEVINKDARFEARPPVPIEEEFPKNSTVVFLGAFAYGTPADVIGHENNKLTLKVSRISKKAEPNFGVLRAQHEKKAIRYHPSSTVAKILKFSPLFLSKLTSSYAVEGPGGRRYDIGLPLKFEGKKMKVLGYTRRNDRYWEYSDLAISLIQEYMKKFPDVFKALMEHKGSSIPSAKEIFKIAEPDKLRAKLDAVQSFLKEKKSSFVTVSLESESFTKIGVAELEQQIIDYVAKPQPLDTKGIKGIPRNAVLAPSQSFQLLRKQHFSLGDRVVYVLDSGNVPLFSKGTVIGIRSLESKVELQVLFDQPLLTGNTFGGRLKTQRGLTLDSSVLLNLTDKQFIYHSKASSKTAQGDLSEVKKRYLLKKKQEKENELRSKKELLKVIKKSDTQGETKDSADSSLPSLSKKNGVAQNVFNSVLGNVMQPTAPLRGPHSMMGVPPGLPLPVSMPANTNGSQELMGMLNNQKARNSAGRPASKPASKQANRATKKPQNKQKPKVAKKEEA
ncbi:hypothetical protein KL933_001145 [Ogataea haglerorum]|uniref:5'-3' exoribonuclease 1 n=1 Tax=Ogataea haglerorum TaxID=1937702 RepID=A0AAN6D9L8_9ASCO|nr:hypothetical protein KL913_000909 [Ogataea haglerorum]KAG7721927.1 hypothetical protein KL949_000905 [Ogataea haglerorum]KAG7730065.1 hypothetical protein KL933_001145 [Ogataea haglerorum]KAG7732508.1 hypothetical protein KL948_001938 [Ogataea haglerorum]KAG7760427.1 hypothetical protein KL947_001271 [Ogataea haglerorum]